MNHELLDLSWTLDELERWETAASAMAKVVDRGTAEAFALLLLDDKNKAI